MTKDVAKNIIHNKLGLQTESQVIKAERFGRTPIDGEIDNRMKILVELNHVDVKRVIMTELLKRKPRDLYISELLPECTNELFYRLRKIKREQKKFEVLYTKDGIIKAKKSRQGRIKEILTEQDLNEFLVSLDTV